MHRTLAGAAASALVIAAVIWAAGRTTASPAAAAENSGGDDALRQLEWLMGEWIDEGPEAVVTSSFRWSPDRGAILGEYRVHAAGRAAMNGTQHIAWDPLLKKVHSWAFDSQGGFSQGIWTHGDDAWVVTTWGVNADGARSSATLTATREGADRVVWRLTDRVIGNEAALQAEEIHLVRMPPRPAP